MTPYCIPTFHYTKVIIKINPSILIRTIAYQHCRVTLTDCILACNFHFRQLINHHFDGIFGLTLIGIGTRNDVFEGCALSNGRIWSNWRNLNRVFSFHGISPDKGSVPSVIFCALGNQHSGITPTDCILACNFHFRQLINHHIYAIFAFTVIGICTCDDVFDD